MLHEELKLARFIFVETVKHTHADYLVDNLSIINEAFNSAILPANSSPELLSMVQLTSKGKSPKTDPHVAITLLLLPELQNIWCSTYSSTPWKCSKNFNTEP